MKRKIIKIDEDKCTGCGDCVPNCPEGALQIINGKARLVGELLCDGLGACIGRCPEGAITIEEREADGYDEKKAIENIVRGGAQVIAAHLKHLRDHNQQAYLKVALEYLKEHDIPIPQAQASVSPVHEGCPGMKMQDFRKQKQSTGQTEAIAPGVSELRQWPIQLHLLSPYAPYFKDADLVIAADCVPFAHPNFHQRFLKGKILIIFCPKLDQAYETYLQKLTEIIKGNNIKSITMVHMEVPCCFGTVSLVQEALQRSGKNVILKDYTVSLRGEII